MSGSTSPAGNITTTQAPLNYMQPYYGTALGQSANLLQSGGPQYYPGQQVASFNPAQQMTMGGTLGLDQGLMQGSGNPYENSMFNQAAQATQGQLASEFAGSGRNLDASMPLRSDQLNNLATNFYGNNYQNSIQNAMAAANQGLGIGNQIQNQSQNLINASQNAYNYNQRLPYTNLQSYESNLAGIQPGSQVSNPYFTNPTANALGTGMAGLGLYNGLSNAGLLGGSAKGAGSLGAAGSGGAGIMDAAGAIA